MNYKETQIQPGLLSIAHFDFQKGLNARAFFKVNDHALGEDLVQNTFMKTWSYLVKGGKILTMKSFLYHILNNLIIDEYRKHKATSLDALVENGFDRATGDTGRIFDILDGKAAALLIQRLPEKYQRVIRMRYLQSLSLNEMSLITGQTRNAMAVQTHRGLEKLKAIYKASQQSTYA
jgi:RNA polymerase sigma factor (sigma-70 family)